MSTQNENFDNELESAIADVAEQVLSKSVNPEILDCILKDRNADPSKTCNVFVSKFIQQALGKTTKVFIYSLVVLVALFVVIHLFLYFG